MISDVLVEAVGDIEEFEREFPALYGPVAGELERLKGDMLALVGRLNGIPAPVLPCRLPVGIGGEPSQQG